VRGARADLIVGVVFLAVTIVGYFGLYGSQDVASMDFGNDPGPGLFPYLLLSSLCLLSLWLIGWSLVRGPWRDTEVLRPSGGWQRMLLPAVMVGTLVAYILILPRVGFLPLTFVFALVWILILSIEDDFRITPARLLLSALQAGGLSWVIYYVFGKLVKVPLP